VKVDLLKSIEQAADIGRKDVVFSLKLIWRQIFIFLEACLLGLSTD
jgi:hypothetical protein